MATTWDSKYLRLAKGVLEEWNPYIFRPIAVRQSAFSQKFDATGYIGDFLGLR